MLTAAPAFAHAEAIPASTPEAPSQSAESPLLHPALQPGGYGVGFLLSAAALQAGMPWLANRLARRATRDGIREGDASGTVSTRPVCNRSRLEQQLAHEMRGQRTVAGAVNVLVRRLTLDVRVGFVAIVQAAAGGTTTVVNSRGLSDESRGSLKLEESLRPARVVGGLRIEGRALRQSELFQSLHSSDRRRIRHAIYIIALGGRPERWLLTTSLFAIPGSDEDQFALFDALADVVQTLQNDPLSAEAASVNAAAERSIPAPAGAVRRHAIAETADCEQVPRNHFSLEETFEILHARRPRSAFASDPK